MKYIFGLILCCAVGLLAHSEVAHASEPEWSWTNGPPTVAHNDPSDFDRQFACPTYIQDFKVADQSQSQRMCVFGRENSIRIGTLFLDNRVPRAAIAYPHDQEFHLLPGICQDSPGCLYSPDEDLLVMHYYASRYYFSVMVLKHVSQRLHRTSDGTGLHDTLDVSNPDYLVGTPNGRSLGVGAIALSSNGKWLVVELRNLGVALMNLGTGEIRRIYVPGALYDVGRNPEEELAVSNDGKTVAMMGDRVEFKIISVSSDCGDHIENSMWNNFEVQTKPCAVAPFSPVNLITRFSYVSRPAFDEEGGQLTFYPVSYDGSTHRIVLRAQGYVGVPELYYLALGDSFSSGEGETDDGQYVSGTNDQFEKCHLSRRSYPFLLANILDIPLDKAKSVACSGAKIEDVIGNDADYWGQKDRLGTKGKLLNSTQRAQLQHDAMISFQPGRVHQESFAGRYQPTIITMGIGGNDVGFMDKLKTCLMPGRCEWASSDAAIRRTGVEIQTLLPKLVSTYQKLLNDSPKSQLYVVGYPQIINPDGVCDPLTSLLLDHQERVFMVEGVRYINQVIQQAAQKVGAKYLDIEQSLAGHEVCDGASQLAMNTLRLGDDIGPTAIPFLKLIGYETFHPTPYGHSLIAGLIGRQYTIPLPQIVSENWLASPYWRLDNPPGPISKQIMSDDLTESSLPSGQSDIHITIPPYTFSPNSTVRIEFHSETMSLGEYVIANDGGLEVTTTLPGTLSEGFHTLHILGTGYDQQSTDEYQVISYGSVETEIPPLHQNKNLSDVLSVAINATKSTYTADTTIVTDILPSALDTSVLGAATSDHSNKQSITRDVRPVIAMVFGGGILVVALILLIIKLRSGTNSGQDPGG